MDIVTPSTLQIFKSLFKADLVSQGRNRRASIMSLLVPIIILISWKGVIEKLGGPSVLSSSITIGLVAVGLMGYANTTARDREKGVFQRLRITPASTGAIMTSRITVQLLQMALMTCIVFIAGYFVDKITLSIGGYVLAFIISLICGAVYLGLAQAIVGLITKSETVNSATRFIYIALILMGAFGELGILGEAVKQIVLWSPYGVVKVLLFAAMLPSTWSGTTWIALVVTLVYIIVFTGIGIKWFKWSVD
jgi:ABC-2 type transport system permease protein